MPTKILSVNALEIWSETFGNPKDPCVLLIMGAGAQGISWHIEFCQRIVRAGFYVIIYDHRDVGMSSAINFAEKPYTMMDLAKDAVGVLDNLKIQKAHIIGASMGGYIAMLLAIHYSQRLLSLTVLTSSPDLSVLSDVILHKISAEQELPYPFPEVIDLLTKSTPPIMSKMEKIENEVQSWRILNGKKADFPNEIYYELSKVCHARDKHPGHAGNHLLAIANTKFNIESDLCRINIPSLIIHGSEDPILPLGHGEVLAKLIPDAKFMAIPDMGHMILPIFWDQILKLLVNFMLLHFR